MKTKTKFYSDDLKLKACQDYLSSNLSNAEVMSKYNIAGKNNIRNWIINFGLLSTDIKPKRYTSMKKTPKQSKSLTERQLEARIKELENALEYEKLRSLAFDTMIDVAEEELNIDIRKKSGSKQ